MAQTTTLKLYVIVDGNGDYGVHEDGFEEAVNRYNESYSETALDHYEIEFTVPLPETRTVKITAGYSEPASVPDAFGAAVRYNPGE